jgi:hypothetical protein
MAALTTGKEERVHLDGSLPGSPVGHECKGKERVLEVRDDTRAPLDSESEAWVRL